MGKHAAKNNFGTDIQQNIKKNRRRYTIGLIGLWLVLAVVIGGIVALTLTRSNKVVRTVRVVIPRGYSSAQIADKLAEEGLISNAYTFRVFVAFNKVDDRFMPGNYRLKTSMSYTDIADKLMAGPKKSYYSVSIPEGLTLKEINERLAKASGRPADDFKAVTNGADINKYDFKSLPTGATSLEGYLFPKTYQFEKKTPPKKIVERLLHQFELETGMLDWSPATAKSLSRHEIIVIASLIEKEAKVPEERPLMAAVIYNRIALGMPLQIDATIQYVLPERKTELSLADTKISSPYNTYMQKGLPPGPIASPGVDSIKAALAPAQVDYLYYVLTTADGHHTFSRNYSDFLKAKNQANR